MKKIAIHWLCFFMLFFVLSCSEFLIDDPVDGDIRTKDFENAWAIVDEWYPYFEYKKINWDSLYTVYSPLVQASHSDEYLLIINRMLLELRDGHVATILKNGQYLPVYRTPRQIKDQNSFDVAVTETYLTTELYSIEDGRIQYGLIGNLGYLRVSTLINGDWISGIKDVFDWLNDTEGLILDVRHNCGGSTSVAQQIVEKCIQNPLVTPGWTEKDIFHNGPVIEPDLNTNYTNPIVILANGNVFSSGEHLVMWMQHIDHVTFIGDTTAGASGNPLNFTLPSGNEIKVSTRCFYRYDGTPIEWNGIVPDHLVQQTETDIQDGRDRQLEYSIEYLSDR
ncbi:MAG: S41 family peptidase [Bacteroidales bacterium]|jgi:hypothetical protein